MPEYQWALSDGEIISADYNRAKDSLSNEQVLAELQSAFQQFGHSCCCEPVNDQLNEVYSVIIDNDPNNSITICAKGTTPGGRSNLNDEQRAQQKSKYINYAYSKLQEGKSAIQLGVYRRDGHTIFCAWKLKQSSAEADTPISKQIKIITIAQAMKEGFVQQEKGSGEYACAFRKEFMYFYIRNASWLHGASVAELADHTAPLADSTTDNESAFKAWFAQTVKENGEPYTNNTRDQYINALKAIGTEFANVIGPFTSIFEIDDVETFERAAAAIKTDSSFEEANSNHGNGSLAAGLELYKRFLSEKNSDTISMFSPEWFREKASEYPNLDTEANQILTDFQNMFAPDYLKSLSGIELLNTIFINAVNTENLCRMLEFGRQIKDIFGSIKGGNSYKYGLYYSNQGSWMTGSHQKPRQLTEEEAIEVGTKLRDRLVAGANAIKEYGPLSTLEDYYKLYKILFDVTEGDVEKVWFLKYYQMLYPDLFATNYGDYAQRTVLTAIGEEEEKYALVRMGQIRFYADKCGISNVMFNKIFWDYYTEESFNVEPETTKAICHNTGYRSEFMRNRIIFGAPGTGKSFILNREKDILLANGGEYERVTFHPDYSYANFVGTYKPVPCKDSEDKDVITYSYVPGPFMRTYVKAMKNSRTDTVKPFLLVIEEINRANVAAVFGDVFQLLDRGDNDVSEYPIQASEDIKKYLAGELGGNPDDYSEILIPDNMFIWATMNSADQGVFPMDTAFKRRWDFTYLGIDDKEAGIIGKKVILGQGEYRRVVEWNTLRKAINEELLSYKVNEDKLMGPYFISKNNLPEGEMIDPDIFKRIFKNKVVMYLFDDAAKQKRITLFGGCTEKAKNQYSKICREFDTKGVHIFCEAISNQFIDNVPEDDEE